MCENESSRSTKQVRFKEHLVSGSSSVIIISSSGRRRDQDHNYHLDQPHQHDEEDAATAMSEETELAGDCHNENEDGDLPEK